MKNQIIIKDVVHNFVQDKPKVDKCWECSLKDLCFDHIKDGCLCSIFLSEEVNNGHFIVESENIENV